MLKESKSYTAPGWGASPWTWAGGWTVHRMRRAIEAHDRGLFADSYAAAEKVTQWAIPFGALHQRISPTLRFPRAVEGGEEGLDLVVRRESEELFIGQDTELGPAFPSLWSTLWHLAMMGFCWWQTAWVATADGSLVVPRTQIWPAESVMFDKGRGRWVAITLEEGLVDIDLTDPRWTLVADGDRPWLSGAIRAIGSEYVDAAFAKDDRSSYSDEHGRPKPIGILPADTQIESPEGREAIETLKVLRESDAGAVFPHGFDVKMLESSANTASLFRDILDAAGMAVAIAVLGTDGTMSKGTGGVYSSPTFAGVAENRVGADVTVTARAANVVLGRYRQRNYQGVRVPPRAVIRMPDTQRDARTKSLSERLLALNAIVEKERANGFVVTQGRVNSLAAQLDVPPPTLPVDAAQPPGTGQ